MSPSSPSRSAAPSANPRPVPAPAGAEAQGPATIDLDAVNAYLAPANLDDSDAKAKEENALQVISWASKTFGDGLVMTSSFGAQSAVMLHLVNRAAPQTPVILIDTGYLFPETYRFAFELRDRLGFPLHVYRPRMTNGMLEAIHGRLWEQGEVGLQQYHQITKIEPMQRALDELDARAWIAGLRAGQTDHRAGLATVTMQDGRYKVHPILRWSTRDVHAYLSEHGLPYHPLYEQGYASIGDWHSSAPLTAGEDASDDRVARALRFQGLKQECGLHLPSTPEEAASRDSSDL